MVHELRTPLSALSGEVEIALRRDRSLAAYRQALTRIADRVTELVDLTGDLAVLGNPADAHTLEFRTASLDAALASVARRYDPMSAVHLTIESGPPQVRVIGDENLLTRALKLLVEHALRHRHDGAWVRLRARRPDGIDPELTSVDLILDATPLGFSQRTWHHLGAEESEPAHAPGLLRLRTAARIVRDCGGSLDVQYSEGSASVHIRLRGACGERATI
jgi:signal transduction histidine kinase